MGGDGGGETWERQGGERQIFRTREHQRNPGFTSSPPTPQWLFISQLQNIPPLAQAPGSSVLLLQPKGPTNTGGVPTSKESKVAQRSHRTCCLALLCFNIGSVTPIPFDCAITQHLMSSSAVWAVILSPFGDKCPDVILVWRFPHRTVISTPPPSAAPRSTLSFPEEPAGRRVCEAASAPAA